MGAAIALIGMKKGEFIPPQCPDYERSETCTFSMMTVFMYTTPSTSNSSWLFNTNPLKVDPIGVKGGNNIL